MAQRVKRLPARWETRVQSLGQEDPLEKEIATHSSILAWRIPGMEEPVGLQSMGFSRQEYWSGLLFPSPGDLPDPRIEPRSPALQADALPSEPPGKPMGLKLVLNWSTDHLHAGLIAQFDLGDERYAQYL